MAAARAVQSIVDQLEEVYPDYRKRFRASDGSESPTTGRLSVQCRCRIQSRESGEPEEMWLFLKDVNACKRGRTIYKRMRRRENQATSTSEPVDVHEDETMANPIPRSRDDSRLMEDMDFNVVTLPIALQAGLRVQRAKLIPVSELDKRVPGWSFLVSGVAPTKYENYYIGMLRVFFSAASGWNGSRFESPECLTLSYLYSANGISRFSDFLNSHAYEATTKVNKYKGLAMAVRWIRFVVKTARTLSDLARSPAAMTLSGLSLDGLNTAKRLLEHKASMFTMDAATRKEERMTIEYQRRQGRFLEVDEMALVRSEVDNRLCRLAVAAAQQSPTSSKTTWVLFSKYLLLGLQLQGPVQRTQIWARMPASAAKEGESGLCFEVCFEEKTTRARLRGAAHSGSATTSVRRTIQLPEWIARHMRVWLQVGRKSLFKRERDIDALFITERGIASTPERIAKAVTQACRATCGMNLSPLDFRHICATHFVYGIRSCRTMSEREREAKISLYARAEGHDAATMLSTYVYRRQLANEAEAAEAVQAYADVTDK